MSRTATVSRVFTFTTTFDSPEALAAWLAGNGITAEQYTATLISLGMTPEAATAALQGGTLTAQVLLTAYRAL